VKSAKLPLLLLCLLVAMTVTAAALGSTNGNALVPTILETKINSKEEVATPLCRENLAESVKPIPVLILKMDTELFNRSFDFCSKKYGCQQSYKEVRLGKSRFT